MTKELISNAAYDDVASGTLNFIQGHEYVHTSGEVVHFDESRWLIVSKSKNRQITINFGSLPGWLQRPAKLVMARSWLEEGKSPSWLLSSMSAFRRLADALSEFTESSITKLTATHAMQVQEYVAVQQALQDKALEKAASLKGQALNQRERRQVIIASGFGAKVRSRIVAVFNIAAVLIHEIDGQTVSCSISDPYAGTNLESSPNIGSADVRKVLTPDQIAKLDRALCRDAQRYFKARKLIAKAFSHVDLNTLTGMAYDPTIDLDRYFGINGHREHSQQEIAAMRGISPTAYCNVGRSIKRFLTERLGDANANEMMALRKRYRLFKQQERWSELERAREYIQKCLKTAYLVWTNPNRLYLELYFGLNGHHAHSIVMVGKKIGFETERGTRLKIHSGLKQLFGERTGERIFAVRESLVRYLMRAVKAQAVRLQLGAARRINALLQLPAQPAIRMHNFEGRRVIEIDFHVRKTWGDEGMLDTVPFVGMFGEIAEEAIHTTQELTRDLRAIAPENLRDKLFLIPNRSFHHVTDLSPKVLQAFIFENSEGRYKGLLQRYDFEDLAGFEFHHIRQTHATHIVEEGGSVQDVARYLGHNVVAGNTSMASVWYVAGGTGAMRKQAVEAIRRGAASGQQFDAIARLKIESMSDQARLVDVPSNQLSFEEAKRRILTGDILEEVPANPDEAVRLLKQKIVINITRYGGCLLPATSGPCPTANACPVGIDANAAGVNRGCGCKYQVIMPHSADQLEEDLRTMRAQLDAMPGDEWAFWRGHILFKIQVWQLQLEMAESLQRSIEGT
ncbi:MAG: site-specific integrase [Acidobacteria bacterium]|nr:site-specific integrase [Acidobacteriota bacterium]